MINETTESKEEFQRIIAKLHDLFKIFNNYIYTIKNII